MTAGARKKSMLSPRQRVGLALEHRETDRIPRGELVIDDAVIAQSAGCRDVEVDLSRRCRFARSLELDIYCLSPHYSAEQTLPAAAEVSFPNLGSWALETELFIFGLLDGVFGWGIKLLGFGEFITLPMRSPLSFAALVNRVERLNRELIDNLAGSGANGVIIADDLAYQGGLLISPAMLREHVVPSLAVQAGNTRSSGLPVFFHCDGNYAAIIPDLVQAGFNGLHCLDRNSGMDVSELRRRYGTQLCLWGSLDVEDTIKAGEPGYLDRLKDNVLAATSSRGFILGTSSGIFRGLDVMGLRQVYRAFE